MGKAGCGKGVCEADKNTSALAKPNQMASQEKRVGMVSTVVKTKDVKQGEQPAPGGGSGNRQDSRVWGNRWAVTIGRAGL